METYPWPPFKKPSRMAFNQFVYTISTCETISMRLINLPATSCGCMENEESAWTSQGMDHRGVESAITENSCLLSTIYLLCLIQFNGKVISGISHSNSPLSSLIVRIDGFHLVTYYMDAILDKMMSSGLQDVLNMK